MSGSHLFMNVKASIPFALTTLRLVLGPVALACALNGVARIVFLPILLTGLLSDIYDGVLARRFGVSTPFIRRYDSLTDVVYYLFILGSAWVLARGLIVDSRLMILALLISEAAGIAVSFAKFGCMPATHTYLAKTYGLALFAVFVAVLCQGGPWWIVNALGGIGLAANAEILAILLLSKQAPVDVLSIFHYRAARSAATQD